MVMTTVSVAQRHARSFAEADAEFTRAWSNPRYTQIRQQPVDVNRVLQQHYTLTHELTFTRAMLWDVEVMKARDPMQYIPTVVQSGHVWANQTAGDEEQLLRASQQRQWLSRDVGLVLERAYLNHAAQRVVFLGASELRDADGALLL